MIIKVVEEGGGKAIAAKEEAEEKREWMRWAWLPSILWNIRIIKSLQYTYLFCLCSSSIHSVPTCLKQTDYWIFWIFILAEHGDRQLVANYKDTLRGNHSSGPPVCLRQKKLLVARNSGPLSQWSEEDCSWMEVFNKYFVNDSRAWSTFTVWWKCSLFGREGMKRTATWGQNSGWQRPG